MKTRFVKLLGLLTVLMVPAMLWVSWPYWHPMWWREPELPIGLAELIAGGESEFLKEAISDYQPKESSKVDSIEVLGWTARENNRQCLVWISFYPHKGAVVTFTLGTPGNLPAGGSSFSTTPTPESLEFFLPWANLDKGDYIISPHAWKRVTGEVLTPSRLKELESGGTER